MEHQLVVFELAKEYYGVDISAVESIIKMQSITIVPHAPAFVEGVTNLRGKVLPVIDLHKRFGLVGEANNKDSRIMVVSVGSAEVGMEVDGVSKVLIITDEAIEPPPGMVTSVDSSFITGIARIVDRLVIMLDLKKVLVNQEEKELRSEAEPV